MADTIELPTRAIRDQGPVVNCCTSCALAACLEAARADYSELSPVFHYFVSRRDTSTDLGLTIDAALSGVIRNGICTQALHPQPYSHAGIRARPSHGAYSDAVTRRSRRGRDDRFPHRSLRTSRLERDMRAALDRGHGVLLGIRLDGRYSDLLGGANRWDARGPAMGGAGHAVAVIGYSDRVQAFVIQDSRGTDFGQGGQWYLPYSATRSNLILEAIEIGG